MEQNEWGRVFPFQNVRIFEHRSTKSCLPSNIYNVVYQVHLERDLLSKFIT